MFIFQSKPVFFRNNRTLNLELFLHTIYSNYLHTQYLPHELFKCLVAKLKEIINENKTNYFNKANNNEAEISSFLSHLDLMIIKMCASPEQLEEHLILLSSIKAPQTILYLFYELLTAFLVVMPEALVISLKAKGNHFIAQCIKQAEAVQHAYNNENIKISEAIPLSLNPAPNNNQSNVNISNAFADYLLIWHGLYNFHETDCNNIHSLNLNIKNALIALNNEDLGDNEILLSRFLQLHEIPETFKQELYQFVQSTINKSSTNSDKMHLESHQFRNLMTYETAYAYSILLKHYQIDEINIIKIINISYYKKYSYI